MDIKLENLVTLVTLISGVAALYFNYTRGTRSDLAEDYRRRTAELEASQKALAKYQAMEKEWETKEASYKAQLLEKDIALTRLVMQMGGKLPQAKTTDEPNT